jgi:hypothetical protein
MISLPAKPDLICSEYLVNSLHVIAPAALLVPVALVPCNLLVLHFLDILQHVTMLDASFIQLLKLFGSLLLVSHYVFL